MLILTRNSMRGYFFFIILGITCFGMLPVSVEAHLRNPSETRNHFADDWSQTVENGEYIQAQLPKIWGDTFGRFGPWQLSRLGGTFYYTVNDELAFSQLGLDIGVNGYLTGTLTGLTATRSFTVTITGDHTYVGNNGSEFHPVSVDFALVVCHI